MIRLIAWIDVKRESYASAPRNVICCGPDGILEISTDLRTDHDRHYSSWPSKCLIRKPVSLDRVVFEQPFVLSTGQNHVAEHDLVWIVGLSCLWKYFMMFGEKSFGDQALPPCSCAEATATKNSKIVTGHIFTFVTPSLESIWMIHK